MENTDRMFFLRKIILLALVFILLLPGATSYAAAAYENSDYDGMSYMLIEMESGTVLTQHDPDRRIYPASTTKLMTALLLMEQKGLDGETTVGTEINGLPNGSSLMNISVGEKISIKDLFYGLMLSSGNDAACTIAVYVSGSVDAFVELMNQRADELGMKSTHFTTPYGCFINQDEINSVPSKMLGENHYTTATDMAKLAVAAAKCPEILEAGDTSSYILSATNEHADERKIINSNPLIHTPDNHPEWEPYYYEYATGMKTGTVDNIRLGDDTIIPSYGNVVASASKDGLSLIALIFDDESEKQTEDTTKHCYQRWFLAADLFDYGFENYAWVDMDSYIKPVSLTRPVAADESEAQEGSFEISSQSDALSGKVLLDSAAAQELASGAVKVEETVELKDTLDSSVQVGDTVGTVEYRLDGTVLSEAKLVATAFIQTKETGTEQQASNTENEKKQPVWLLWVILPACAVGGLFAVRWFNLHRRRRRRRHRSRH